MKILPEIKSIADLDGKCQFTPPQMRKRWVRLARIAAENLGGPCDSWVVSMQTLRINVGAVETEYPNIDAEASIVDEINNVRQDELASWEE